MYHSRKTPQMHQKLKFNNPFRVIQFAIQEMAFRLCTKQSRAGKLKKVTSRLYKFAWLKLVLRNLTFWKCKSVTFLSWVNHSWYWTIAAFKCLFLDFGSESMQFNNWSIYVQLGVPLIKFIDISLNFFISHMRDFPWLCMEVSW